MDIRQLLHVRGTRAPLGFVTDKFFSDSTGSRALTGAAYTDGNAMTDEACVKYCDGLGYGYAGTEYSSECCTFDTDLFPLQTFCLQVKPCLLDRA